METIIDRLPEGEVYSSGCPSRAIIDRIADKWTVLVMGILQSSGRRRFGQLRRQIEGISQKMLTQTLRDLERDGLVKRTIYAEIPPRVEYELTPLGSTLCEPIEALMSWAHAHLDEIEAAQRRFDANAQA